MATQLKDHPTIPRAGAAPVLVSIRRPHSHCKDAHVGPHRGSDATHREDGGRFRCNVRAPIPARVPLKQRNPDVTHAIYRSIFHEQRGILPRYPPRGRESPRFPPEGQPVATPIILLSTAIYPPSVLHSGNQYPKPLYRRGGISRRLPSAQCASLEGAPSDAPPSPITLDYLPLPQVCILDGWGENPNKDEFNAIHSCEVSIPPPGTIPARGNHGPSTPPLRCDPSGGARSLPPLLRSPLPTPPRHRSPGPAFLPAEPVMGSPPHHSPSPRGLHEPSSPPPVCADPRDGLARPDCPRAVEDRARPRYRRRSPLGR